MRATFKDEEINQDIYFDVKEEERIEQIKVDKNLKGKIVKPPRPLTGPPVNFVLTQDGVTYTLALAGVAEKTAFYKLVSKRKLMGV
jgi:hypothetical protein